MIEFDVEVPGTPEEVWEAIATGPGISAWFVPAEVDPGEGGSVTMHHGHGDLETVSRIAAWEPPHRLVLEDRDWSPTPGAPAATIATEYLVEARDGGTCVVRLVQSGFGAGDDWERAVRSFSSGWPAVLADLRLYLTHFPGQRCAPFATAVPVDGEGAWARFAADLGIAAQPAPGDQVEVTATGAPPLAGVVQRAGTGMLALLLDRPAPGIGFVGVGGPGDQEYAFVRAKLFGDGAEAVAARDGAGWEAWLAARAARV